MSARSPRSAALLVLGLLSCLAPAARAQEAFLPGEEVQYRLTYLGIHAASARISVGRAHLREGVTVWPLITQVQTESVFRLYPVKDRFVSWWIPSKSRSQGFELSADENGRRRRQSVQMEAEPGRARVTTQHAGKPATERWHEVSADTLDVASATFALRNRPLAVGRTYELPIFTGSKQFTLSMTVEAVERRKTVLGEREVYRARAKTGFGGKLTAKRDMLLWITTDPSHVVVRIDAELGFGSIVADLSGWSPGGQPIAGAPQAGPPHP